MPSHVGSYNGKGDPDNFLHLFEGAIRMKKWLMPVACSILNYEDLKAKFQSHFSQQKRFTKTHLLIHNIKQREGESVRAFATRTRNLIKHLSTVLSSTYKGLMEKTYTWIKAREVATNGAPNDRRDNFEKSRKSSGDNNRGQKRRDMFFPYQGPNHGLLSSLSKSPKEILATEKVAKTFEQPPWFPGSKWSRDKAKYCHFHEDHGHDTNQYWELRHQIEEAVKSGRNVKPAKTLVLMISKRSCNPRKRYVEEDYNKVGEITFPPLSDKSSADPVIIKAYVSERLVNRVYMDSGSSCEVIYEHCSLKLKPSIRSLRVDSKTSLVGFSGEYSWPLGEVPLEIMIGEGLLTVTKTLNFVIVRSDSPHNLLLGRTAMQQMGIMMQKKIVANNQYPEQTITIGRQLQTKTKLKLQELLKAHTDVFAWTTTHMIGVPRTIMVGGVIFNTENRVNESKHVEPVKQKKRSMEPKRNEVIHTQVEEFTKANILREVKYQTWLSNPVIAKKADGRWKPCIDFTDINKACPKENYSLPTTESKVEDIHQHQFKCFLDAYKGYHQISIDKKDEEKTAFYTREGVFCYKRLPFGLKNAGATNQRLIDKVFICQVGRNMGVNAEEMVIKSDSEEEIIADIKETLERLRVINLKLNPKKCSFGVEEGRFSGHLIIKQGIKADP
ncbi:reverse transcriptase domain-containing protein [Tanacetum coccineum]